MAPILGKRKRRTHIDISVLTKHDDVSAEQMQALLRQHFESKYKPLKTIPRKRPAHSAASNTLTLSDGEESAWEGLDDDESAREVQVIEHTTHFGAQRADVPKEELKAFMTPRIPSITHSVKPAFLPSVEPPPTDSTERALISQDLALQRLLSEPHILNPTARDSLSQPSSSTFLPHPNHRHRTVDLRLQALGVKRSLLVQLNMPMKIRKGIEAKRVEKEETKRKEARETGVILEKEVKRGDAAGPGRKEGKRDRGVGAPAVGRWKGGMLVLGRRDVEAIEGRSRDRVGRGSKGGGRGRGRGRGSGR
ncbi:hypothetical protein MMC13_005547 [Lambiella insularis]|nr:hypothetical protein [Lambiella insularis]